MDNLIGTHHMAFADDCTYASSGGNWLLYGSEHLQVKQQKASLASICSSTQCSSFTKISSRQVQGSWCFNFFRVCPTRAAALEAQAKGETDDEQTTRSRLVGRVLILSLSWSLSLTVLIGVASAAALCSDYLQKTTVRSRQWLMFTVLCINDVIK